MRGVVAALIVVALAGCSGSAETGRAGSWIQPELWDWMVAHGNETGLSPQWNNVTGIQLHSLRSPFHGGHAVDFIRQNRPGASLDLEPQTGQIVVSGWFHGNWSDDQQREAINGFLSRMFPNQFHLENWTGVTHPTSDVWTVEARVEGVLDVDAFIDTLSGTFEPIRDGDVGGHWRSEWALRDGEWSILVIPSKVRWATNATSYTLDSGGHVMTAELPAGSSNEVIQSLIRYDFARTKLPEPKFDDFEPQVSIMYWD